jgi:dTMP kinase
MLITKEQYKAFKTTPKFIVVEGINGAGKSTFLAKLAEKLRAGGEKVTVTFEPGATSLGKNLREIVLSPKRERATLLSELLLFAADRAEHLERIVRPALLQGEVVLCDRYIYSTVAFQGYARGLELKLVEQVCQIAVGAAFDNQGKLAGGLYPDLVILLDIEVEEALSRIAKRKKEINDKTEDHFDDAEVSFHNKIRNGFLEIAKNSKERFLINPALEDL